MALLGLIACDAGVSDPPPRPTDELTPADSPLHVEARSSPKGKDSLDHDFVDRGKQLREMMAETTAKPPHRGVVLHIWGVGGDETIVVDSDKKTTRIIANPMGKPPSDQTHRGHAKQIDQIMQVAGDVCEEDASEMPTVPDVREDLYVFGGGEACFLNGHPFSAIGKKGRPAAAKTVSAVKALSAGFHAAR